MKTYKKKLENSKLNRNSTKSFPTFIVLVIFISNDNNCNWFYQTSKNSNPAKDNWCFLMISTF